MVGGYQEHQTRVPSTSPRRTVAVVGIACLLLVTACMSLDQMAPPVEPLILTVGGDLSDQEVSALTRGREIYLIKCSTCHRIEPIIRYTVSQWEEILPRMAVDANLSDREQLNLEAYIMAAHTFSTHKSRPSASHTSAPLEE